MNWKPQDTITDSELNRGLRINIYEGLSTQATLALSSGVFLVGYALELGASNLVIGLLAAIPALMNLLQIPGIYFIERWRNRRMITTYATLYSRLLLLVLIAIPFVLQGKAAIAVLIAGMVISSGFSAVSVCAWNSWMRDLVPDSRMGDVFSRKMSYSLFLGIALSLAGAFYIDHWRRTTSHDEIYAYSILFSFAFIAGLIGVFFITGIPEPRMTERADGARFRSILLEPFRDQNFRKLLLFLGSWNFAVNLAAPFFAVYMLKRLGLDMVWVIGLTALSQLMNAVFYRVWGRFIDRFSNKSVLGICGPLFMISILAWTFTTFPEKHAYTVPLLITIHVVMGIGMAGVTLAGGNIALKLAPRGSSTAYLGDTSLINSLTAGAAPIIGGQFADFFAKRQFTWDFTYTDPDGALKFQALNFQAWDFFFFLAFLIGLYSLHRLAFVREQGEVAEGTLLHEILSVFSRPLRNFTTIGGLRNVILYPSYMVRLRRKNNGKKSERGNRPTDNGQVTEGPK